MIHPVVAYIQSHPQTYVSEICFELGLGRTVVNGVVAKLREEDRLKVVMDGRKKRLNINK